MLIRVQKARSMENFTYKLILNMGFIIACAIPSSSFKQTAHEDIESKLLNMSVTSRSVLLSKNLQAFVRAVNEHRITLSVEVN